MASTSTAEPLEVAVCAQHNNGGLKGNIWWESEVRHFFPIGEVNGSHGVYRPGGSALNAGQCGGLRAAQFIAKRYAEAPVATEAFGEMASEQITRRAAQIEALLARGGTREALASYRTELQARMTACGAHVRDLAKIETAIAEARAQWTPGRSAA